MLTAEEICDIRLWFGWGVILEYPTTPKAYLKEALKPSNRKLFLEMSRDKRKAVLRFVIEECNRRGIK